jgi:predicted Zn-dependent peptidase
VTIARGALTALLLALLAVPAAVGAEVRRERLGNGMTVVVRENPLAPVVAVSLLVRMGTRWERAEPAGISNFVHAVMVKGTRKRGGHAVAEAVADLGGKLSAAGDVDYSAVTSSALARFWKELLVITAEVALEPALSPEEVDNERDWLLSRVQRRRENPPSRGFDEFFAALYGDHPYALPTLGTEESLRRIDHAAVVRWYQTFYRPERMVLAVSGQVKADDVLAEARRLFGHLPPGPRPEPPSNAPPQPGTRRVVIDLPAQQAQILVGGLAPPMDHPDHAAVKVLGGILGGGMAGRLFAQLRDREALAYSASAYYDPVKEPGALVLYLGTSPESAERAEAALLREVARLRAEGVAADELQRAKGYLLGNDTMDRRTNARQAWYLAFHEIEEVGADFTERYRRAIERVTADDVFRVARTYLERLTIVVVRPPASR